MIRVKVPCPYCKANNTHCLDDPEVNKTYRTLTTCRKRMKGKGCGKRYVSEVTLAAEVNSICIEGQSDFTSHAKQENDHD